MTIRSLVTVSALALTCAISMPAFSKTTVCKDISGTYDHISGGKILDTMKIAATCNSMTVTYSDGVSDVLKTDGKAEVLNTAADGSVVESIIYYVDTAAGAGAALRVTRYVIDPGGKLSVAQIISLQLDAAKNLMITTSAISASNPAETTVDTWTRTKTSVPPKTPPSPAPPATYGLKPHKYFSVQM